MLLFVNVKNNFPSQIQWIVTLSWDEENSGNILHSDFTYHSEIEVIWQKVLFYIASYKSDVNIKRNSWFILKAEDAICLSL